MLKKLAIIISLVIFAVLVFTIVLYFVIPEKSDIQPEISNLIKLPLPEYSSEISVEEALLNRRSIREYKDQILILNELSQLLWAAQGVTDEKGFRTAPSAGGLYPLELYVISQNVADLEQATYEYYSDSHSLKKIINTNIIEQIVAAAYDQEFISQAPAIIVMTGVFERTTQKYGDRGKQYVYIEAGHAAQNVYLQAYTLGLGTVTVGGFEPQKIQSILNLTEGEEPIYIIPVGKR